MPIVWKHTHMHVSIVDVKSLSHFNILQGGGVQYVIVPAHFFKAVAQHKFVGLSPHFHDLRVLRFCGQNVFTEQNGYSDSLKL